MLHPSKSQSILQWFNSMVTKAAIESLSQFADGLHFHNMVLSIKALGRGEILSQVTNLFDNASDLDTSITKPAEEKNPTESAAAEKDAPMDTSATEGNNTAEDVAESDAETVIDENLNEKDVAEVNKEKLETKIQKRYDEIKAFIDGFFSVESSNLIIYSECIRGKELELAKIAVLLLSAMVQSFLSSSNQQVYTTTLLDAQVQEDIKECLSLVLLENSEDGPLRKTELHRILSRPSKCKAIPRRRTASRGIPEVADTPEVPKSVPKKRRERVTPAPEDVYESPLKNLLESPQIQYKAAMFKRDAELTKLRNDLHTEESKVVDLRLEKRSLNDELEKKKRELEFLKEEYRKFQASTEELEKEKIEEMTKHQDELQKLNQTIQTLKEENEYLKTQNTKLLSDVIDFEEKLNQKKPEPIKDDTAQINELLNTITQHELTIKLKDDKIKDLKQNVATLEKEVKGYKDAEEYSKMEKNIKNSPKVPEKLNNIIVWADERTARDKLKEKETECEEIREHLIAETEKLVKLEQLYKSTENERIQAKDMISKQEVRILNLKSELDHFKKQLSIYETWSKTVQKQDSDRLITPLCSILDTWPGNASECSERVKEEPEPVWSHMSSAKPMETRRTKSYSGMSRAESICSRDSLQLTPILAPLTCNEAEFGQLKKETLAILRQIKKKFMNVEIPQLSAIEDQAQNSTSIKEICSLFHSTLECLKSLKLPPFLGEHPVKRRGRSQTIDEGDSTLQYITQNKYLEGTVNSLKQDMEKIEAEHKTELENKVIEIKSAKEKCRELELSIKELNEKLEEQTQLRIQARNKYLFAKECANKMNKENERIVNMLKKCSNRASKEDCKECKNLLKRLLDLTEERNTLERDCSEISAVVQNLQSKLVYLECLYNNEREEKKQLEFKMQRETAFMRGSLSERNAVIDRYFKLGRTESKKLAKSQSKTAQQSQVEPPPQVLSFNTYILHPKKKESPADNSMAFANKSIKSSFFQADDEEDFLNHSSIAQIHREVFSESDLIENGERLDELRRRNTLCLPHLQSSYPLEMQNMTPSEAKYYEGQGKEASGRTLFDPKAEEDLYLKQEAELHGEEYDETEDSHFALRKRKASEIEGKNSTNPPKRLMRPSTRSKFMQKMKSLTPIRKTGAISKTKTFKTPQSVRSLMQKKKWR